MVSTHLQYKFLEIVVICLMRKSDGGTSMAITVTVYSLPVYICYNH